MTDDAIQKIQNTADHDFRKMREIGFSAGFPHGCSTEGLSCNVGKQNQQYGNDQHVQNRKWIDA